MTSNPQMIMLMEIFSMDDEYFGVGKRHSVGTLSSAQKKLISLECPLILKITGKQRLIKKQQQNKTKIDRERAEVAAILNQ